MQKLLGFIKEGIKEGYIWPFGTCVVGTGLGMGIGLSLCHKEQRAANPNLTVFQLIKKEKYHYFQNIMGGGFIGFTFGYMTVPMILSAPITIPVAGIHYYKTKDKTI